MALAASADREWRRFRGGFLAYAALVVIFALGLSPLLPLSAREVVSSVGLLLAGTIATVSVIVRARRSQGADRTPWTLIGVAGIVAILGNVWVGVTGSDPVSSPSVLSDGSIAIGIILSTVAVALFPGAKQRGAQLLVMLLDGLVAGGALLLVTSVLVYSELLESSTRDGRVAQVFALVLPTLDVLLATFAVLLVVRASRADRLIVGLVAGAFILYAAADLSFAVRAAEDTFHFGTLLDLGWIAGYLTLGLSATVPTSTQRSDDDEASERVGLADAVGTALVFGALVIAAVVQVVFGRNTNLAGAQIAIWVVVVLAAAARQILLTVDNTALRRGLERRVAEQTSDLRRLARQNEVLITSVGDGVYGVDHDGRVTFVNPSAAAALGYRTEELEGRRAHEMFHGPAEDGSPYPWTGCYIHEAIAHGQLATAEEDEYVRADGTTFPVEITASPLVDDDQVRGAVVTFRDVTQRREVDRMKNEFLSVVSHELRTPLTSIRGSLGLVDSGRLGPLPERAASLVTVALQSSERLTRLINDLLDIERMESGVRPMELATIDARHLLETAAEQIEGMSGQLGVRVELDQISGRVRADEDRIMQTLMNLLGNAIKFSQAGSTVRLSAAPEGADVHFRVSDEGPGIPVDQLETIFERFAQVDSSDTRQQGGTGLGLTISKGIVERHGGRIWVESELGHGTVVHFTLPAARAVTGGGAPDRPGASTVLVVDDDPDVVEEFSGLLRAHGYRPIGATDGETALALAAQELPRAVLLDLMMPGTTGAQVLAALRSEEATRHIPVVVISGLGPESDQHVARTTDSWLIKPVSEERLVKAVSIALSGHAPGGSVLLVEDDEDLAGVIAAMLGDEGLDVVHAATASAAVIRGSDLRPDVIVLDMRLPDGNGSDVVAEFRRRGTLAQTPLVVYSAVDVEPALRDSLQLGRTVFLTKGRVSPEELRDQVLGLVSAVTSATSTSSPGGNTA